MRLRKPPILEAWIRFDVEGTQVPTSFDEARSSIAEFIKEFPGIIPRDISVRRDVHRVQKFDETGVGPPILLKIRAVNSDETNWLQVGGTSLAFNVVRKDQESDYAGFTSLLKEALEAFVKYKTRYRPTKLTAVTLHYVDLITMKRAASLRLEDYFKLTPTVPPEFGAVGNFRISMEFINTGDLPGERTSLVFARSVDDAETYNFYMEWDCSRSFETEPSDAEIKGALELMHGQLQNRFRASFTKEQWQSFEPEDKDNDPR